MKDEDPREFLRRDDFSPNLAQERFRNAKRSLAKSVFLSHCGADREEIEARLIEPVLHDQLRYETVFFFSKRTAGSELYKELVQAALHWCDKFIVAISERSIQSPWVRAEVEWALRNRDTILAVRLDQCGWHDLLEGVRAEASKTRTQVFDLSSGSTFQRLRFRWALKRLIRRYPLASVSEKWAGD